jgi:hypothetical protein
MDHTNSKQARRRGIWYWVLGIGHRWKANTNRDALCTGKLSRSHPLNTEVGIVLRLLRSLTASAMIHEIDNREISRHCEENPILQLVFCASAA